MHHSKLLELQSTMESTYLTRLAGADGTWSSGVAIYPQVSHPARAVPTPPGHTRPTRPCAALGRGEKHVAATAAGADNMMHSIPGQRLLR